MYVIVVVPIHGSGVHLASRILVADWLRDMIT